MENVSYENTIVGTEKFIIDAIVAAINADTEKNKKLTEYFLDEYFIKSDKNKAMFYYDGRGTREFYIRNISKHDKFETDICNLARNHKRLHIGTIDRRNDEMKMFTIKNFGYFMEDPNFNIFDYLNNLIMRKYQNNDQLSIKDGRKCMLNTCANVKKNPNMNDEEKKRLTMKEILDSKILNAKLSDDQKEKIKSHYYQDKNERDSDNLKRTLLVYIGCGVILETDTSWLDEYNSKIL